MGPTDFKCSELVRFLELVMPRLLSYSYCYLENHIQLFWNLFLKHADNHLLYYMYILTIMTIVVSNGILVNSNLTSSDTIWNPSGTFLCFIISIKCPVLLIVCSDSLKIDNIYDNCFNSWYVVVFKLDSVGLWNDETEKRNWRKEVKKMKKLLRNWSMLPFWGNVWILAVL